MLLSLINKFNLKGKDMNKDIKNADMPAMPICNDNGAPMHYLSAGLRDGCLSGLTKREMFAKDSDVKEIMSKMSDDTIQKLVDWEVNWSCYLDIAKAYFTVEAKFKIIKADALLAELEK